MAEITLADYTGYIYLEMIRARELADRHSRALAEVYAQDRVLQHFSVPRFKVPKLELTIPVLVTGARFSQVLSFRMPGERFAAYVNGRMADVVSALRGRTEPVVRPRVVPTVAASGRRRSTAARQRVARAPSVTNVVARFHEALRANPDPSQPGAIVRESWAAIFELTLTQERLLDDYKRLHPRDEPFRQSLEDVLRMVTTNTVVDGTAIQSLLINPETNVVKNGSSETSVFTIHADMVEEGFFIRRVRDEETNEVRVVVEFD